MTIYDKPRLSAGVQRAGRSLDVARLVAAVVEHQLGAPVAPRLDAPPALSRREQELLALVAEGLTDAQIAGRLFISVHTVGSHLDRIRAKTGCRRRAELTRLALRLQLAPPAA